MLGKQAPEKWILEAAEGSVTFSLEVRSVLVLS